MSDGGPYTCPADGCSFTGPKSSVLGHYSGKQDDAHDGGYPYAKQQLEAADGGSEGSPEGGESQDGGAVKDPSFPEADGGSKTTQQGGGRPSCPGCGRADDVYDADSVKALYERHDGVNLNAEHRKALDAAVAACTNCGTAFTPEGYDE